MPKAPARETILRQWQLLMHLPRSPQGITVADLRQKLREDGFPVTRRTVERDLQKLLVARLPLEVRQRSQVQQWSIMKHGRIALPELPSASDALLLLLVQDYLSPLLPPPLMRVLEPTFASAAALLQSSRSGNTLSQCRDKVRAALPAQPLVAPRINKVVQSNVAEALLQDRMVLATYRRGIRSGTRTSELSPVALLQRGLVTYLVARCPPHADVQLYALHDMLHARLLRRKAQPAEGFDLDGFLDNGFADCRTGRQIRLQLLVTRSVATHLGDCCLSHDQTIDEATDPAGWFRIEATVNETPQLLRWLREFGDDVRVVSPRLGEAHSSEDGLCGSESGRQ